MSVTYKADGDGVVVETGEESLPGVSQPSTGEDPHPGTEKPSSQPIEDSKMLAQPSAQAEDRKTSCASADAEGQPLAQPDVVTLDQDSDLAFKKYNSKASFVCGILQIIFGVVSLLTGVVGVATGFSEIGIEITGVLFVFPGAFGIVSAWTKTRRHITTCMVLSGVSSMLGFLMLMVLSGVTVYPSVFFGFIVGLFIVLVVALVQVAICCCVMFECCSAVCGCCVGGDKIHATPTGIAVSE